MVVLVGGVVISGALLERVVGMRMFFICTWKLAVNLCHVSQIYCDIVN